MKKLLIILLSVASIVFMLFMGIGCKTTTAATVAETTAAETTAAETTAAETTVVETTAAYNPGEKSIYLVSTFISHPVAQTVHLGFLDKAKELGYTNVKIVGTLDNDDVTTIAAGEQAIAKKPNGMWFWAFAETWFPLINKAHDAGIVTGIPHASWKEGIAKIDINIVPNEEKMMIDTADVLIKKMGNEGIIGIVMGSKENTSEMAALSAFQTYVSKQYPNITLLEPLETITYEGGSPESISKTAAYILANPKVKALITMNGTGAETMAAAVIETKRDDIIIMGRDDTLQTLDYIKAGKIFGTFAPPLYDEGATVMEFFDEHFRGEEVPYQKMLDAKIITQDTPDLLESSYTLQSTLLEQFKAKAVLEGVK